MLPTGYNTTCDIFRSGGSAGSTAVPIRLKADFVEAHRANLFAFSGTLTAASLLRWTHIAQMELGTDIRDGYVGGVADLGAPTGMDYVKIPDDASGTRFDVVFVERVGWSTPQDHLKVYLQRKTPSWPTSYL